ncbi:hypothetical protein ALQ32_200019 [Pseudomonas syringae pv. tagetis]|uniref:Uncharacterized protein n=1 Tax=Pseudomonas syringae pv. tagetis TaxID=129140 RepID=A0A3M3YS48_9PSED|nr:hypothetical protein ALQ32_200019 [Pseudomonas syringae pv. tagetis]RMU95964.1 hypothetical protein ALP19_200060 [Pseudomonas syringae pv. tomato]
MPKKLSAPFTLEEDIGRLKALLPTEAIIEEFGDMLQQLHRSNATERERLLALGCVTATWGARRIRKKSYGKHCQHETGTRAAWTVSD